MRPLFLVLAKLTGLLHLYWTLSGLAQMSVMFGLGSIRTEASVSTLVPILGFVLYFVFALVLAWILLFKTEWLADVLRLPTDESTTVKPPATVLLHVGIQLIGVYAVAQAVPGLLRTLTMLHRTFDLTAQNYPWHLLAAPLAQLVVGVLLAFKADAIVSFLHQRTNGPRWP